jgi:hypothetical protein
MACKEISRQRVTRYMHGEAMNLGAFSFDTIDDFKGDHV